MAVRPIFLSSTCHGGRGLPNSVFWGLFLKNNGPVWHFQPPVCSFWPAMGHFWHFRRPGLQQPHICKTQTAHPGDLVRESPQTCKPPTHLATIAWQGIMGPCNAQCRALGLAPKFGLLGTLHIPQQFPPFCPALRLWHTLPRDKNGKTSQNAAPRCGGATWLWFGALDHNMAGLRGTTKSGKCH